jgi:thiamine-phosphate pyrophosphorylase
LIINDRLDVALAANADGLHIGQSDMPYAMARQLLSKDKIIGLSVENMDQVLKANDLDVDYIGISPVFSTPTKTDTAQPFGLEGIRQVMAVSLHPAVAIGGINFTNATSIIRAGANGIAVVSAICSASNPCKAAYELKNKITL